MTEDLTNLEKRLLESINFNNNTSYDYTHLMEWNTDKDIVEHNLEPGEIIYTALGVFVAIKP